MENALLVEKMRFIGQKAARALKKAFMPRALGSLTLLFVLAVGGGALIKSLVNDTLTIGFDDYRLSHSASIDLNTLQKDLIKNGGTLATTKQSRPIGKSCAESSGKSE